VRDLFADVDYALYYPRFANPDGRGNASRGTTCDFRHMPAVVRDRTMDA